MKNVPAEVVRQAPPLEYFSPTLLYTLARFSRWDDILRQPAPPKDLRYTTGIWHYVRGLAYTAQGKLDSAAVERDRLVAIEGRHRPSRCQPQLGASRCSPSRSHISRARWRQSRAGPTRR